MATKAFDLAVATGSYQASDGTTKKRYQNIGVAMKNDEGGLFLLIEPWVNLAGVPHEPGKSVLVSMFPPREKKDGFSDDIPNW